MATVRERTQGGRPWAHYAELAGAIAWLAFGGLLFWQTFLLKGTHVGAAEGIFGPVFYPRALAVLILVCASVLVLGILRRSSETARAVDAPASDPPRAAGHRRAAAAFAGLLLYTWLLPRVGFLLLTPLMILALTWLMGERRFARMIAFSLALTVGLYTLFRYAVHVLLPDGLLG